MVCFILIVVYIMFLGVFGSFAESTRACLVIAGADEMSGVANVWNAMMFPLLISAGGIVAGIVAIIIVDVSSKFKVIADVEKRLKGIMGISTIVVISIVWILAVWLLPPGFWMALWSGLLIGYKPEYYSSHCYTRPWRTRSAKSSSQITRSTRASA